MNRLLKELLQPKVAQFEIGNETESEWLWFGLNDGTMTQIQAKRPIMVNIVPQGLYVWFIDGVGATEKLFWPTPKKEREELRNYLKTHGFPIVRNDYYLEKSDFRIR